MTAPSKRTKKPAWLKVKLPAGEGYAAVARLIKNKQLHTVCQSALCPNRAECWGNKTATFMILGDVCSRQCRFCAVSPGTPQALDPLEPGRVAQAVVHLQLDHAVITSVTRDDLADGGAGQFAETIRAIRHKRPDCSIEVLVPDFAGDRQAAERVMAARPEIFGHNVETVARLYPLVRPQAQLQQSLALLARARSQGLISKSGLMLGLGESTAEVEETILQLARADVQILTLGQYLQPRKENFPVRQYIAPAHFERYRQLALARGIAEVLAGPLVRSSYRAKEVLENLRRREQTKGQIGA